MANRFKAFARTPLGRRLDSIVSAPERYSEHRAFSREGFPAVTALISLVKPELEALRLTSRREFDAGKQYVGWAVGQTMRKHGHEAVGRSRVPGGLFTVGGIWSAGQSEKREILTAGEVRLRISKQTDDRLC